ncbi:hypothetical protein C8Q76DRAFT_749545 [Earliella scabrosa]|nr:hypothetical protein C8Q76DRAFT_749545 [Earliella scabrosa]
MTGILKDGRLGGMADLCVSVLRVLDGARPANAYTVPGSAGEVEWRRWPDVTVHAGKSLSPPRILFGEAVVSTNRDGHVHKNRCRDRAGGSVIASLHGTQTSAVNARHAESSPSQAIS